jgi:toxin HigB-1
MAIKSFRNEQTAKIFAGERSDVVPTNLARVALRKLVMVNAAVGLRDLTVPPNNRLEKLSGDRKGQHSIRINDQYRVCFAWKEGNAYDVEIVDYH